MLKLSWKTWKGHEKSWNLKIFKKYEPCDLQVYVYKLTIQCNYGIYCFQCTTNANCFIHVPWVTEHSVEAYMYCRNAVSSSSLPFSLRPSVTYLIMILNIIIS